MRDPLERPATPGRLTAAIDAASLGGGALDRGIVLADATPSAGEWVQFLSRALLTLGAGLLLSGIVSFFAFNWASLGRFGKFALLEAGIVACALAGWRRPDATAGRVAIFAASVLVGPLLGVYGQTYQTGADPWSLFAAWALLIAPWVIAARFTTLWVLAIALVDVALVLYWLQVRSPDSSGLGALPVVAAVHALAVCTWEWQRRRALPWLTESWAPRLLVAAGMGLLLVPATLLLAASRGSGGAGPLALVVLFSAAAAGLWYYQTVRSDPFMLTSVAGTGFVLITVLIGRLLILELHLGLAGPLLMAIVVIAEVTLSVAWLRRIVRGGAES